MQWEVIRHLMAGGCQLQAAEAVCTALDGDESAGHILESVTSLLDKSLLQTVQQEGKKSRLAMLETIRDYGLECLEASGEMETTQSAHAHYYLAEQAEPELAGPQQALWLEHLERERRSQASSPCRTPWPRQNAFALAALRWGVNSTDGIHRPEWERRQRWYGCGTLGKSDSSRSSWLRSYEQE